MNCAHSLFTYNSGPQYSTCFGGCERMGGQGFMSCNDCGNVLCLTCYEDTMGGVQNQGGQDQGGQNISSGRGQNILCGHSLNNLNPRPNEYLNEGQCALGCGFNSTGYWKCMICLADYCSSCIYNKYGMGL